MLNTLLQRVRFCNLTLFFLNSYRGRSSGALKIIPHIPHICQEKKCKNIFLFFFHKMLDILIPMWYIIIKERENKHKGDKNIMYKVTYKEIDTDDIKVEVMDGRTVGGLKADWAFEVISVEEIEVPKKKRFFFF